MKMTWRRVLLLLLLLLLAVGAAFGLLIFFAQQKIVSQGNDLASMKTAVVTIGPHPFHVWVADTHEQRMRGLMFVRPEQLTPLPDDSQRGMLFVFEQEQRLGFWMKNTITPLDIAYADHEGKIVKIYTMTPLDENTYPSYKPARFAMEVNAGVLAAKGIGVGDKLVIPASVLTP